MIKSYVYANPSGVIAWSGEIEIEDLEGVQREFTVLEGEGAFETHYVAGGQIVLRPEMAAVLDKATVAADGQEVAALAGLPVPCTVYLDEVPYTVADGVFEVSFDAEGTHALRVAAWPYRDAEFSVEAL